MPPPRTYAQLRPPVQRVLTWLGACGLITQADLVRVGWPADRLRPDVVPVTERNVALCLRRWEATDYLRQVATPQVAYQLGAVGVALLRQAGQPCATTTSRPLAARVRPGLLLASTFAVHLWRQLRQEATVQRFAWSAQPFHGTNVRADGLGSILTANETIPDSGQSLDQLTPHPDPWGLSSGQTLARLILEVDRGTETGPQLRTRAQRWRTTLEALQPLPPRVRVQMLWVVDGPWSRADQIWRIWLTEAQTPLWVTTVADLIGADGRWHPWTAIWRDELGRPRTLTPTTATEQQWRGAATQPPTVDSLAVAMQQWDAPYVH